MNRRTSWSWRVRRLAGIGWHRRLILLEALVLVGVAGVATRLLPFRWLRPFYGRARTAGDPSDGAIRTPGKGRLDPALRDVRWALGAVERAQAPQRGCLPRAMAGRLMLLRRGYEPTLHIGAFRGGGGEPDLHAWLTEHGTPITGVRGSRRFTTLVTFDAR